MCRLTDLWAKRARTCPPWLEKAVLATIAGLAVSTASPAMADTILLNEGDKIEAELSLKYPTRFYFKYDAGAQLIFNEPDTAGGTDVIPKVAATVDDKGDVYLSVVSGMVGQKVAGFLTTEGGRTYVIELTIQNIDADQVEIVSREARDKAEAARLAESQSAQEENLEVVSWRRAATHHDTLSDLMRALYHGSMPEGFKSKRPSRRTETQDGVLRRVETHFRAENVEALTFELTNGNDYALNPELMKMWFRPYIAVAFASDSVEPGHSTQVYVLRARGSSQGGASDGR